MSIQWADDFSRYGTGLNSRLRMLDGLPYAQIQGPGAGTRGQVATDPDPSVVGGRAFNLAPAAGILASGAFRIALPTPVGAETIGICWRGWLEELPLDALSRPTLYGFLNNSGEYILTAVAEINGAISIFGRSGGNFIQLVAGVVPIIVPASWIHYEFVHDNATGEGSLYINGIERVTWTGVDTGQTLTLINAQCIQGNPSDDTGYWIKDLVIWDGTGAQNNSVMGTVLVRALKPNADVTLGGWVPSTGTTGFNLLNKTTPDDSTYLSADDAPPAAMSFDLENLPADVTSVRGLISVTRSRKVDGGDGNLQSALTPNGTDYDDGADRPLTTAFSYNFDVSQVSPDTTSPWSPGEVDTAEIQIDRTL